MRDIFWTNKKLRERVSKFQKIRGVNKKSINPLPIILKISKAFPAGLSKRVIRKRNKRKKKNWHFRWGKQSAYNPVKRAIDNIHRDPAIFHFASRSAGLDWKCLIHNSRAAREFPIRGGHSVGCKVPLENHPYERVTCYLSIHHVRTRTVV